MDTITKQGIDKISAMIVSLGGTPAPIIKSISHYQPEFVSFFASQDTFEQIAAIRSDLSCLGIKIKSEVTITDNVNDLLQCHEKAEDAVKRVIDKGYKNDEVIVDYTGGTKNMSVALTLAAITHGFLFSYVGGGERTKNGVGIVVDGQEKVFSSINPWDFFAIEERKKVALLFNQCQYRAAKNLMGGLSEKSVRYRALFKKVTLLLDGYYLWDLFRHAEARDRFDRARIEEIAETDDCQLREFATKTLQLRPILETLASNNTDSYNLKIYDLYANAERRFKEGKTDDAILRLYRVTEMIAQERLLKSYDINTSDVDKAKVPDAIKDELLNKYLDPNDSKIKIPQEAAYRLLKELGDPVGLSFEENIRFFRKIQQARNYSYLAHGFNSSGEKTYESFRESIIKLGVINTEKVHAFPELG